MHRDNWDDLRYVLAVADAGTVSGAARALGVNHATVLRRIAAFEDRSGAPVFDRSGQGYRVLADREKVIDALREVESSVGAVSSALRGAEAQLSGTVRITSTDTICTMILPGVLRHLAEDAPDLRIELQCTNAHLDLSRLHADISIRPAMTLADDLIGTQAGDLVMATYRRRGSTGDLPWLSLNGMLSRSRAAGWMAEAGIAPDGNPGADSFLVLREMVAQGIGQSILPVCIARDDPRLVYDPEASPVLAVPLWVVSHTDVAGLGRLWSLRERLTKLLRQAPELATNPA